jgi:hypothetical protein
MYLFPAAMVVGALILAGCALIGAALEQIGNEMKRANDLKEAELRGKDLAITEPGSTSD